VVASVVAVSIGVAIIGRLSPYDWYQSPPDDFSLWKTQFQMTLYNYFWQVLSTVFKQGVRVGYCVLIKWHFLRYLQGQSLLEF